MRGNLFQENQEEIANLLSQLIQIDTTNPPGNETKAAEFLASYLQHDGFTTEIIESAPSRGNVITRLKGTGQRPNLLLLSHLDVVPANPSEWSVNPFSGEVKEGFVWGRGALDMKGLTAIEVIVLKLLKQNRIHLKGDIILAATADEEMGGTKGAEFLLENHKEKVFAEYVINEGGGSSIPTNGKTVFTVNTAEKGLLWFKVKAKGTPGHGSIPEAADNPLLKINKVMNCLAEFQPKVRLVSSTKQFLTKLARADPSLQPSLNRILLNPELSEAALQDLEKTAPAVADEVRPRLKMSITPTIIRGGYKENVIPSECEAVFDCRILPGQSTSEAFDIIRNLLAKAGINKLSFEVIQAQEPTESKMETPLYDTIKSVLDEFEPGCVTAPLLMAGGTDSRFFRKAGSVCYGFHPLRSETKLSGKATRREHGIDERISVENLVFGASVLYETVKRFMT